MGWTSGMRQATKKADSSFTQQQFGGFEVVTTRD
jgi:hypothetical protein